METVLTAILLFTIQVSVGLNASLAPLAIGGVLIAIVFAGGPISGAHLNPVVSLAIALRKGGGYLSFSLMGIYWIAQLIGGILGSVLGGYVTSTHVMIAVGSDSTLGQALTVECVYTFILCFVVLNVATNPKVDNNQYYALAIGFVIMAGAITVGPISGGAFNPVVALGLSVSSKGAAGDLGYALAVSAADFVGGALAAAVFYFVIDDDGPVYDSIA